MLIGLILRGVAFDFRVKADIPELLEYEVGPSRDEGVGDVC